MRSRLAGPHDEQRHCSELQAQHFRISDDREVDGPAPLEGQARELRHGLSRDVRERLSSGSEGNLSGVRARAGMCDRLLERATLEELPDAVQPSVPPLELEQALALVISQLPRHAQLVLGGLPLGELAPVVLRQVLAPLALVLLGGKLGAEASEVLVTALPQAPKLIEHQRRIGGLAEAQTALQSGENILHPPCHAFLLLDAVLEPINFFAQVAVGLLELRPIAEKREDPMVFGCGLASEGELEKAELSKCLHEGCGRRRPASHQAVAEKRCPRSAQYSSHLFSIILRAQR